MPEGALTPIQTAYCRIREAADEALDPIYRSGLLRALEILAAADPDAETEPSVPGRVYGSAS
jgi:hypothetical protein